MLKQVMDHLGSTNARLREIFTAVPIERTADNGAEVDKRDKDIEVRKRFEEEIQRRAEEGMGTTMRNYRPIQAVDMAMDSAPISKSLIPLMLYAQGKVNLETCANRLQSCGCDGETVRRDSAGKVLAIDMPRFVDFHCNIIHSVVTRRLSAQNNKYSNTWPYYKTEARGVDPVSKLRADATSMAMDAIVDEFGDRQHNEQCVRYGLIYGRCFDFKASAWEIENQTRFLTTDGDVKELETVPVAQGISFVNPHISRCFYDTAYPPSTINTNKGCEWLGFWDVCRKSTIRDNPGYFNTDQISTTTAPWMLYWENLNYFNYYYDRVVPPPSCGSLTQTNEAIKNDRSFSFGGDSTDATDTDSSVYKIEYYRKIVPKDHGIGDYPNSVWARLTATADGTVIFAEFLYSRPAAYLGINEDENRLFSPSMATLLLGFQDQMSNLCTQMLLLAQLETMGVFVLNLDAFMDTPEGKSQVDSIRKRLKGQNWSGEPHIIEVSLSKMADLMGNDSSAKQAVLDIKQASTSTSIDTVFNAMLQLLNLMDRLLSMSPAEIGQPAPREISATEVVAINNTTSSVYDAISNNIDSFREAKKRILFESMVNCWSGPLNIPLQSRYDKKTIEAAGFTPGPNDGIFVSDKTRSMVTGHPKNLIPEYPYIFSSRDGAERSSNVNAAASLVQLIQYAMQVPQVLQAMGKDKLFRLFNEVARLLGSDVLIEMAPGESEQFGDEEMDMIKNVLGKIEQAIPQIHQALTEMDGKLAEQEQVNTDQEQALKGLSELAKIVLDAKNQLNTLEQNQRQKPPEIPYKDAPPQIRSQIEARAGFTPAPPVSHIFKEGEPLPIP